MMQKAIDEHSQDSADNQNEFDETHGESGSASEMEEDDDTKMTETEAALLKTQLQRAGASSISDILKESGERNMDNAQAMRTIFNRVAQEIQNTLKANFAEGGEFMDQGQERIVDEAIKAEAAAERGDKQAFDKLNKTMVHEFKLIKASFGEMGKSSPDMEAPKPDTTSATTPDATTPDAPVPDNTQTGGELNAGTAAAQQTKPATGPGGSQNSDGTPTPTTGPASPDGTRQDPNAITKAPTTGPGSPDAPPKSAPPKDADGNAEKPKKLWESFKQAMGSIAKSIGKAGKKFGSYIEGKCRCFGVISNKRQVLFLLVRPVHRVKPKLRMAKATLK